MSYVERHLLTDERVVFRTGPHPLVFAGALLWLLPAIGCLFLGPWMWVGLVFLATAVVHFISVWVPWANTEYAVTNMRVVMKSGVLQTRTSETLLTKVESVDVQQGLLGRMFNYGSVILHGTGGTRDPFLRIFDPFTFRKHVQEQILGWQRRG